MIMASNYQILFNGQAAAPDFYNAVAKLEVEENMDLPGAVQINLPVSRSQSGDLTYVSESTLQPMVNVAVVINPQARAGAAMILRTLPAYPVGVNSMFSSVSPRRMKVGS